jgi:hypothetical protein
LKIQKKNEILKRNIWYKNNFLPFSLLFFIILFSNFVLISFFRFTNTLNENNSMVNSIDYINYNSQQSTDIEKKFEDKRFVEYYKPLIKTFNNNNRPIALYDICHSSEHLYFVGAVSEGGFNDAYLWLAKSSKEGELVWEVELNTTEFPVYIPGFDICIDNQESVYVAGDIFTEFGGLDFFLCKYSSTGVQLWNQTFGTYEMDHSGGICIDESEGIYFVGCGEGYESNYSLSLWKFSMMGNLLWNISFGYTEKYSLTSDLTLDSMGNIHVIGNKLYKFSSDGEFLLESEVGFFSRGISIDENDNFYIIGDKKNPITEKDEVIVSKYSSEYIQLWNKTISEEDTNFLGFDIDYAFGKLYLSGRLENDDLFCGIFTSEGKQLWYKKFIGENYCSGSAITVDSEGDFFIVGPLAEPYGISIEYGGHQLFIFQDSDIDDLSNQWELDNGLDPFDPDCDDDGFTDGEEILQGTDPLDPTSNPKAKTRRLLIVLFSIFGPIVVVSLVSFTVLSINYHQKKRIQTMFQSKRKRVEELLRSVRILQNNLIQGKITMQEAKKKFEVLNKKIANSEFSLVFSKPLAKKETAQQVAEQLQQKELELEQEVTKTQELIEQLDEELTFLKKSLVKCKQQQTILAKNINQLLKKEKDNAINLKVHLKEMLEELQNNQNNLMVLTLPSSFQSSLEEGQLHPSYQSLREEYLTLHRQGKELMAVLWKEIDNQPSEKQPKKEEK